MTTSSASRPSARSGSHWDGARLLALIAGTAAASRSSGPSAWENPTPSTGLSRPPSPSVVTIWWWSCFPPAASWRSVAWIPTPPPGVKIVNVRPRPRPRCGDLDTPWRHFEQAGIAALGRVELCGRCPRRPGCSWPGQYSARSGRPGIHATHAHFGRAPDFATQLADWAGTDRVLTLLDEVGFAATSFRRRVTHRDLALFADVLDAMPRRARDRPGPRLGLPGATPVAGPDGRPPIHRVAAAVLLAGLGDRRSGPRLGSSRRGGSASSGMTCSSSAGHPWNRASGTPTAT